MCRDGPSYGLYMFLYEYILREGKRFGNNTWIGHMLPLIAGGITGKVAYIITGYQDAILVLFFFVPRYCYMAMRIADRRGKISDSGG